MALDVGLARHVPLVVDEPQRGLVGGRNVHENMLHLMAGAEVYAHMLVAAPLSLLLESVQAFVSAQHPFIHGALERQGAPLPLRNLLRGL